MNRRALGIRLVAGLIVIGGLGAGSIGSTLAAPGSLDSEGLTITARFEKCTEGSPDNCKQIKPEEPSKRGGKPEKERPPRGGTIQEPPDPQPPTGGRIRKDDTPKQRDEPKISRTIRSSGGNSEAFTATHLAIPVVNSSDAPVAQPAAAAAAAPVAQPVARPVVAAAPSAGIGPESAGEIGLPALLTTLAALFGAGAIYMERRPDVSRVRK